MKLVKLKAAGRKVPKVGVIIVEVIIMHQLALLRKESLVRSRKEKEKIYGFRIRLGANGIQVLHNNNGILGIHGKERAKAEDYMI